MVNMSNATQVKFDPQSETLLNYTVSLDLNSLFLKRGIFSLPKPPEELDKGRDLLYWGSEVTVTLLRLH